MDKRNPMMVFALGGTHNECCLTVGGVSPIAAIEMARASGAIGVSLHGKLDDGRVVSGEMNMDEALALFM